MTTAALWLLLAGPLGLALMGLVPAASANAGPGAFAAWARRAALGNVGIAVVMAIVLAITGPLHTPALPGIGLWFDSLTAVMFVLVSFVGAIVVHYSRNYMAGDPDHGRFTKWLCLTLAAVLVLIVSGNLVQFAVAWLATSIGLGRLLLFYRDRPAAILAERKKFIASRIGDLCIAGAMLLLYRSFGGLDYATLFAGAKALSATPGAIHAAAGLFVAAALLKSAQFPLHGWLIEVMETPTPVSALLHAGIINAGGFLLLRFSPIVGLSTPALDVLVLVGGFTALFGSVVMLTQSSIKVSLAWSTIAQMGFMMLQCGLGAWSAALLHIVAHSLYKAHAFLSSGSVIDLARASWSPSPGGAPHPARMGIAVGLVLAVTLLVATVFGATITEQPGVFALGAIMLLGLTHLIAQSIDERPNGFVVLRTLGLTLLVATAYFGLQWAAAQVVAGAVPAAAPMRGLATIVAVIIVVAAFAAVTVLQGSLARSGGTPRWQALHVHVANGFYVNTIANRLVLRLWPTGR
jgi:NAD(P)H-quinone oxidoreductase subunit 5